MRIKTLESQIVSLGSDNLYPHNIDISHSLHRDLGVSFPARSRELP